MNLPPQKPIDVFCTCWSKMFDCKVEYGCGISCPLHAFVESLKISAAQKISMSKAIRKFLQTGLDKESAQKIIEDKFGMTIEEIKAKIKT